MKELNPYLFEFMLKLYNKDGIDYILAYPSYIPNIFNILIG